MSIFTKKENSYDVVCLSFYLCPEKRSRIKRVHAESSCLYFLAKYNFDFKKCFFEGLDFKRLDSLKIYEEALKKTNAKNSLPKLV